MKKEGCRYSSQGSTRLQFQQKVKQMLSYEFENYNSFMSYQYFADNKIQVAEVSMEQVRILGGIE